MSKLKLTESIISNLKSLSLEKIMMIGILCMGIQSNITINNSIEELITSSKELKRDILAYSKEVDEDFVFIKKRINEEHADIDLTKNK